MSHLTSEFSLRPPTLADALALVELINANIVEEYSEPDFTLSDLAAEWQRPNFNLATDAWLVVASDGTLAGYTSVRKIGEQVRIDQNTSVHQDFRERGVEKRLLDCAVNWALEHAPRDGTITIRLTANDRNPWKVRLLTGEGYAPVRHDWIMEIRMEEAPPPSVLPEGIQLAAFRPGQDDRDVHAAIQEAFADIWGHTDETPEEWQAHIVRHDNFAPERSFVARDGQEVAGAIMAFDYPNLPGWIEQVAVRRPWRGRGLGLALLRRTFGAFYASGVKRVQLAVDAESMTGATRVYERAGMRAIRQFTRYAKTLQK